VSASPATSSSAATIAPSWTGDAILNSRKSRGSWSSGQTPGTWRKCEEKSVTTSHGTIPATTIARVVAILREPLRVARHRRQQHERGGRPSRRG
jgi:hypothetical protein